MKKMRQEMNRYVGLHSDELTCNNLYNKEQQKQGTNK